ncbi:MAG: hypothetical protein JXB05_25265 [Myxococcaceae bacterium]|nr:hypothetical protein [Myxococcaceae bacterium]
MNQAAIRRLPQCALLLLVPLLVASTPSPFAVTKGVVLAQSQQPHHLAFAELPAFFIAGTCTPLRVEVQDSGNQPTRTPQRLDVSLGSSPQAGSFHATSECLPPAVQTVGIEPDTTTTQVWFKATLSGSLTLSAFAPQSPLGTATSVPIPVLAGPAVKLKILSVSPPAIAGADVQVLVAAVDLFENTAEAYRGTVRLSATAESRAQLPADYQYTAADLGKKTFTVRFLGAGNATLNVVDTGATGAPITGTSTQLLVAPGDTQSLWLDGLPNTWQAGDTHPFQVLAKDAFGNPTVYNENLRFTSSDSQAHLPSDGPLQRGLDLTLKTAGSQTVTVTSLANASLTHTVSIQVFPSVFNKLLLQSFATNPVGACNEVTLEIRAVDTYGNPMRDGRQVELCKDTGSQAVPTDYSELELASAAGDCVIGNLNADTGFARVRWRSDVEEEVDFRISYDAVTSSPVKVVWESGLPDAAKSSLSFDKPGDPPTLKTVIEKLALEIDLRDACGNPAQEPSGKPFAIIGEQPLAIGPPSHVGGSLWRAEVRLPECPTDPMEPLALWPAFGGEPLVSAANGRLSRNVQPLCADLLVKLTARPKNEGVVAEAGAELEFLAELRNEGQETIPSGLLQLKPSHMIVLEARLDGGDRLSPRGEGFGMPDLHPSETLTVKVKAQASAQINQPPTADVWYASAEGIKLTPSQTVTFERGDISVDVGCGCQAGELPGQLLPWLALLLAASRPRERLRRLRRNERIDHPAPWR